MDISFSPSGQLVASVSRDRSVRLWVPTVQGETGEFRAHTGAVRSIHFSPDGQRMVTASDDKSVKIWGVSRRKFISALLGHNNWVRCARFSPNGQLVATCSDDKTVRLYDPNSSLCVHVFQEIKGKWIIAYTSEYNSYIYKCRLLLLFFVHLQISSQLVNMYKRNMHLFEKKKM